MKKKKILSALLALSMMFVITACGDKDKDSSKDSKAQTSKLKLHLLLPIMIRLK